MYNYPSLASGAGATTGSAGLLASTGSHSNVIFVLAAVFVGIGLTAAVVSRRRAS